MRLTIQVIAAIAIATAFETGASAAVLDVPVTPLIVRLYAEPPLPETSSGPALQEAQTILTGAGLRSDWVVCTATQAGRGPCAVPLQGAELAVRVVRLSSASRTAARETLGYSLVDPKSKAGALATIYLDRVMWLADAAGADHALLLGRAIVHEIGHLLLGTTEHTGAGVMRAIWSRDAVRGNRAGEWQFAVADARRMRAAVSARSAAAQLARN